MTEILIFILQNKYLFFSGHYHNIFLYKAICFDRMLLEFERPIRKIEKVMNF